MLVEVSDGTPDGGKTGVEDGFVWCDGGCVV